MFSHPALLVPRYTPNPHIETETGTGGGAEARRARIRKKMLEHAAAMSSPEGSVELTIGVGAAAAKDTKSTASCP